MNKYLHMDSSTNLFTHPLVQHFKSLTFDLEGSNIIVGARDHIVKLSMEDLNVVEVLEWKVPMASLVRCKSYNFQDCSNYVKLVVVYNDTLLACGSSAHNPMCTYRSLQHLSSTNNSIPDKGRIPHYPHDQHTYLMTSEGYLYTSMYIDSMRQEPLIVKSLLDKKLLYTSKSWVYMLLIIIDG
ncbi:hypothetical protein HELRODRAFT_182230 [Helobdella robusta]|uniref:Sema domain-containing protein n=1 Tax=Helobdella robusta TaxID=6412 RepID=T1FHY8_HELRO|nr:hypothetical protein HELRODRAFT_182230 [Helobdella robusta]ESN91154.1 hypothetical protein HELRODRAFT_182230 [Helobdella robusta]